MPVAATVLCFSRSTGKIQKIPRQKCGIVWCRLVKSSKRSRLARGLGFSVARSDAVVGRWSTEGTKGVVRVTVCTAVEWSRGGKVSVERFFLLVLPACRTIWNRQVVGVTEGHAVFGVLPCEGATLREFGERVGGSQAVLYVR